ncbi:hypothetical protein A2Y85_07320 [candidate division WOR-3 bacterium RBG_13_43_14]|uniref:Glycosyl hydrolase-like 10 domain-containing protein n=1 Tax=candidate division WOR-3 bacterium RBG_13_43_14 TaxID=1802590 RepID=A0A1F4U3X3_UNCW3|nr:MAG: hypothetical protein A2Y85_07320 [candidate division WOR-3 bacterium RBG_13_43_14]
MAIVLFLILANIKGVWVPRWAINDGVEILNVLDGRFNHIFLQIFALGETYYPSEYAVNARKSDQWLHKFIEEAHRRNIQVSAWINLYYSWGYAPKRNSLTHPVNRYPAWYVQDKTGRSIIDYSIDELEKKWIEGYYLAPGDQQVKEYLLNIVSELVSRYSFDGVHFDYVRYPGPGFIYDPAIRSQFMRYYCLDPIDTDQEDFIYRYGYQGNDELHQKFRSYVVNDLSSFITLLSRRIKELNPNIIVSAAVKPDLISARRDYCQDWQTWLNQGSIDLVCLMSYGRHIEATIDKVLKTGNSERIAVGIGVYLLTPEEVQSQVNMVRNKSCAGFVCFSYDQIKKNRAYLEAVR